MPANTQPAPHSPEDLKTLVRDLRRELIIEKTQVLELQDRVRQQQTEHGDAVALLGQAELLLEQKIAYILKLDQSLTERIRELEMECDRKTAEIENRGRVIAELESTDEKNRAARDQVIADLQSQVEAANQEVGKAHEVARKIDLERHEQAVAREASEKLQAETADQLKESQRKTAESRRRLEQTTEERDRLDQARQQLQQELAALRQSRDDTTASLNSTRERLKSTAQRLEAIESSRWWKLGGGWRALFGPKL